MDALEDCIGCVAGKYINETGSAAENDCIACGAGKYVEDPGSAAENDCIACVAGTYVGSFGSHHVSHCRECRPGSYTDTGAGNGATTCTACSPGNSTENSTESCTREPGLYGAITLDVAIEDLTADDRDALASAVASSIATAVGVVDVGRVRVGSFTGGSLVVAFFIVPDSNGVTPTASSVNTALGSGISFGGYPGIQILDVAAPTRFCAVPTYADVATDTCVPCPAGKDIMYGTVAAGSAGCIDCGAGKYRNVSTLSCTNCSAGSVTADADDDVTSSGAVNCTKCLAPQASENPTEPCALCPAGKFSDPTRQCISCLPGYHSDAGSQQDTIGDTDGNNPQSTTIANESCKKCRDVGPTTGATFEVCLGGAKGGCEESQAGYRPLDSTDMITELDAAQRNLLCTDVSVQQLLSTVRSLTKLSLSQCGTGYYLEGADCEKCGSELLSMILAGVAAVAVTSVSAQQLRLSAFRCVLVFSALRSLTKRCCDRRRRPTGSPSPPHAPSVLLCLSPLSPLSQACARRYMDVADHIGKAYGEYDYWMAISQGLGQMKRFLALLTPEFGFPASIIELGRQIKGYVYGRHGH